MGSEETRNLSEHSSMDMYSRVKFKASHGKVYAGRHGNSNVENVKSMNAAYKKFREGDYINSGIIGKEKEGVNLKSKPKELAIGGNTFATRSMKMARLVVEAEHKAVISSREIKGNKGKKRVELANSDFDILEESKDLGIGYEVGDMVWGKVKSHPWWPGQIFDEAFASPSVCSTKKEGHMLVAFYGDSTYGWFEPLRLIPFDSNYNERSKQTDTQAFLTAVGEAEYEVNRRAALGLTCCCRNANNFRPTSVESSFEVDVSGFEPGSVYSEKLIERARENFQPSKTLSFVRQLALTQQNDVQRTVEWMKYVAQVLAYRKAVFEEFDETYAQAFGVQVQPLRPGGPAVALHDPKKLLPQVITRTLGESKGFIEGIKFKDQKRKKSLSTQSDGVKFSRVQKLSKVGNCVSKKTAPLVATSSLGSVGKEAITADKNFHDTNLLKKPESPTPRTHQKYKALVDLEDIGTWPTKTPPSTVAVETLPIENVRDHPSALKPLKKRFRLDEFASNKCQVICDQEVKSINIRKLKMKKSLASVKEGNQKTPKVRDEKMVGSSVSSKLRKDSCMKPETIDGAAEPTMLIIEFPPQSTLPSVSELKARFVRFGNLDELATRVFWKSSTCRVVFKNISSAQAAYNHATRNRTLFGNLEVNYCLKALKVSAPEFPKLGESSKWLVEKAPDKILTSRSLITSDSSGEPRSTAVQQLPLHPSVPLKSCLKKSPDDEMGSISGVQTDTPHTEFFSSGNASFREAQFLPSTNKNNGSNSEMHKNCNVVHIVNAINMKHCQADAANKKGYDNTSTANDNIDISQEMLYLLKKCSEIVADLKSSSWFTKTGNLGI